MKKRTLLLFSCLVLSGVMLGACQKNTDVSSVDTGSQTGEVSGITAQWELVQFTVNDQTTMAKDMDADMRKNAPGFVCEDGAKCVVSLSGKDHPGTITEQDGTYVIDFDDTDQDMTGTIEGNTLTLVNTKGTVTFVFEKK